MTTKIKLNNLAIMIIEGKNGRTQPISIEEWHSLISLLNELHCFGFYNRLSLYMEQNIVHNCPMQPKVDQLLINEIAKLSALFKLCTGPCIDYSERIKLSALK